ncbi:MAG TPA: transketolase C-terminal domain-containing protein, partial [Thermoanaerobaculia bacterium]|nr:transketolase C-terminal domain-containing protein [Thermoanaerobaculia bacterium]
YVITVEEGSLAGGFGSAVMERCEALGIHDVKFHRIGIPDEYVHHGAQDVLRAQYDLHPEGIAKRVRGFVGERAAGDAESLGDMLRELTRDIPDADLERLPKSDQVDDVVYGVRERVAK